MTAQDDQHHGPAGARAAARSQSVLRDTVLVVLLFSAMNLGKYFTAVFVLKLLPFDILLVAVLMYTSLARRFRFRMGGGLFTLFVFMALDVAYELFSVIAIDGGATANLSLGVALLRNAALIFAVAQLDYDDEKTRRWLVAAGVLFSLIAIAGYLQATLNSARILSLPALHDPGIFYSVDNRQIRLQGLREDPNFFSSSTSSRC